MLCGGLNVYQLIKNVFRGFDYKAEGQSNCLHAEARACKSGILHCGIHYASRVE